MVKKFFKQGKRGKKETKRNRIKRNKTKNKLKRNKTKNKLKRNKTKNRTNLDIRAGLPPLKTALGVGALTALSLTGVGGPGAAAISGLLAGTAAGTAAGAYNWKKNDSQATTQQDLEEFEPMIQKERTQGLGDEDEQTSRRQTQILPAETIQEIADIENIISQGGEQLITSVLENIESYREGTIEFAKLKNILSNLNWSIFTSVSGLAINYFRDHIIDFFDNIRVHERTQVLRELSTRLKNLGRSESSSKQARGRAREPIKLDGGGDKTKRRKPKRR